MRKNSSTPTQPFKLPPWDRGHIAAVVVAVALLATVVVWTFPRRSPSNDNSNQRSGPQVTTTVSDAFDQPAPAFSLPAVDGMTVTSSILFQKFLVVLTFWSVECQGCQSQLAILESWIADSNTNAAVVAVNTGNDQSKVKSVIEAGHVNFSVLLDGDGHVTAAYGADGLPATFFIRQGIVAGVARGVLTADQLQHSVDSLLSEPNK